jgi:hypothetical protein
VALALGIGVTARRTYSAAAHPFVGPPSCPTHDVGLHYVKKEDKWVCPMKGCTTLAMRVDDTKAKPPKAPKRTKTLMEVFHDDPALQEVFSPTNHEVRPTSLGLRIEYDKVNDEERYYLFDLPLKMDIDVTDYVEQVIDAQRDTVSLVLLLSNVRRT